MGREAQKQSNTGNIYELTFYNYAPLMVTVQFNVSCLLSHNEVP